MKTYFSTHRFQIVIAVILCLAIGLSATGFATAVPVKNVSVILQGKSLAEMDGAVMSVGGVVTHRFTLIKAVAADVPETALGALRDLGLRVTLDAEVQSSGPSRIESSGFPEAVGANELWAKGYTGKGIGVAVVDTGIGLHPDLLRGINGPARRVVAHYDALEDDRERMVDGYGHGTYIAGIIGNAARTTTGFAGVAPGVKLIDVHVMDKTGKGKQSDLIDGIEWVVEHKDDYNVRVMNLSLFSYVDSPYWASPVNQAVEAAYQAGIVVVAAAGNLGDQNMTIAVPGNDPYVITVGAFTDNYTPRDPRDDYIPLSRRSAQLKSAS